MSNIVVAHNSVLLARKEVTFGVYPGSPTIAPGFVNFNVQGKNVNIKRPNGRKRFGESPFPAGPYELAGNFDPNPDPDTCLPFVAWGMGAQTAPVAAPYFTSALTGATTVGAGVVIPVTAGTGTRFISGDSAILGAGTANVETVVISLPTANNFTATTTKTHAIGDTAQALSPSAFFSTLSYGATLPSFMLEYTRNTTWDFLGIKVDTMKLGYAPGALFALNFGLVGQTELLQASPGTPAYSVAYPLHGDTALPATALPTLQGILLNGAALSAGTIVRKWDASLANNLDKTLRQPGSRLLYDIVPGQRKATGAVTFSFADDSIYTQFLGAATGPGNSIAGLSITLPIASQTYADPSAGRLVPYSLTVRLPNLYPVSDPVAGKQYGPIDQVFTFDAAEQPGSNNDLLIDIVTASSAIY